MSLLSSKTVLIIQCIVGMLVRAFNLITQEAELVDLCEIEASMVYIVSSRPFGDTGRPSIYSIVDCYA